MRLRTVGFFGALCLSSSFLAMASCSGSPMNPFGDGGGDGNMMNGDTGMMNPCGAQTQCSGKCVDTATDPQNCGTCGKTCGMKEACSNGSCVSCMQLDVDKDGFNACDDCDDNDPNVNPGAFEVGGNNKDDNCDGKTDEVITCDMGLVSDSMDPLDMVKAMDICDKGVTATYPTIADTKTHQIANDWGSVFKPQLGATMAALSTGIAADTDDTKPPFDVTNTPQGGTDFMKSGTMFPVTAAAPYQCGAGMFTDPMAADVRDYTELKVQLKVPTNAKSFAIDALYLTAEYPEALCTGTFPSYDDPAFILLDSMAFKGNIASGGAHGRALSVKSGLLTNTTAQQLAGTGMEKLITNVPAGAATAWMTFEAPVVPGETITLRFVVLDMKDGSWDTQMLLDHFRWQTKTLCGPMGNFDGGTMGCPDGGVLDASGQ